MTDRTDASESRLGRRPGSSQSLRTHWQRFFRTTPATGMDTLDSTVDAPRGATGREWEVFCRQTESEPLTHVGSVSAPTAGVAREQAATLFGHAAQALWLCPADETVRVQDDGLGVGVTADEEDAPTMDEGRMDEETLRGGAE